MVAPATVRCIVALGGSSRRGLHWMRPALTCSTEPEGFGAPRASAAIFVAEAGVRLELCSDCSTDLRLEDQSEAPSQRSWVHVKAANRAASWPRGRRPWPRLSLQANFHFQGSSSAASEALQWALQPIAAQSTSLRNILKYAYPSLHARDSSTTHITAA